MQASWLALSVYLVARLDANRDKMPCILPMGYPNNPSVDVMPKLSACLVLVLASCLAPSHAASEQITLAFEATVTNLPPGQPFETGISIAPGDTIRGKLTFTPDPGGGGNRLETTQSDATASFLIDGNKLATTSTGDGIAFLSLNNNVVSDDPVGLVDQLSANASFDLLPAGPEFGITRAVWSLHMASSSVLEIDDQSGLPVRPLLPLESGSIPGNVDAWNYFANHPVAQAGNQFLISLRNNTGGSVDFGARVVQFTLVPEPSALWLGAIATIRLLSTRNGSSARSG